MADDYDYDDDTFDLNDNWLYVEDDYPLEDELAETQIAEPGYSGTNCEIAMDSYAYDVYGYWEELEYMDDAYWDSSRPKPPDAQSATTGQKRKRKTNTAMSTPDKRRKTGTARAPSDTLSLLTSEPVLFHSRRDRFRRDSRVAPMLRSSKEYALLPDWRDRFAGLHGSIQHKEMPMDMRRAAEAHDEETPHKIAHYDAEGLLNEGHEGLDEAWEDDEENEEGADGDSDMPDLDPEMLKVILRQRLGEAGLGDMDEEAFMQTIARMLSEEGDQDSVTNDLANSLLGRAGSETGSTALSGWLSQQGVSLPTEDDASSLTSTGVDVEPMREDGDRVSVHMSPPDSAIGAVESTRADGLPLRSGSSGGRAKKTIAAVDGYAAATDAGLVEPDVVAPPARSSINTIYGATNSEDALISTKTDSKARTHLQVAGTDMPTPRKAAGSGVEGRQPAAESRKRKAASVTTAGAANKKPRQTSGSQETRRRTRASSSK